MLDAPVSTRRSQLIDALRAALAIWVVFAHLIPWTPLAQGSHAIGQGALWFMQELQLVFQPGSETHPAVLCFIVLSGYCIHRNGLRRNSFGVGAYAIRRVFRIYPVYLLASLLGVGCFLVATHTAPTIGHLLSGTQSISSGCFVEKLALVNAVDPNIFYCVYQGNAPLNTVMAEMWLYALYPPLLLLALRFGERTMIAVIAAGWIAGMVFISRNPVDAYWWNHASVLGFLLYWWVGAKFVEPGFASQITKRWYLVVAAWIVLSVAVLGHVAGGVLLSELRKLTQALAFGMLAFWVDSLRAGLPWALDRIGKAGYSIYAFHAPLVYTLLIFNVPWWLVFASAIAAGIAGHTLIERPSIAAGRRLARPKASLPMAPETRSSPPPPSAADPGEALGTSATKVPSR